MWLNKKTSILQLLLCSSVKLFRTTPQPSIKKGPSFLLQKTLIPEQQFSFFSSSSQLTSSHGVSASSFTILRGLSSSCYSEVHGNTTVDIDKEDQITSIPIRAYFFSTSIDLKSLLAENQVNFIPPTLPVTNHIVLRFSDNNPRPRDAEASLSGSSSYSYLVVFQYGSVVTFNIVDHEVDRYLKIIEKYASGSLLETRKDCEVFRQNELKYELELRETPNLPMWMQIESDYIMLQRLDIDGIRLIGSVLGQRIALDYHVRQVGEVVAEFTALNRGIQKFGTYIMRRRKLFRIVGKGNSKLADVILRHELLERSEIARKDAKYSQMWDHLQETFKLPHFVANLESNLKLVEENTNFLSEEMENKLESIKSAMSRVVLWVIWGSLFIHRLIYDTYF